MRKHDHLQKLYLRIIIYVLVFSLIGVVLLIEQQGYKASTNTENNTLIDEDTWYNIKNEKAGNIASNASKCLILYDKKEENSYELAENIKYVLNSINVEVTTMRVATVEDGEEYANAEESDVTRENTNINNLQQDTDQYDLLNGGTIDYSTYDDLILCFSCISSAQLQMDDLTNWLSAGGHLMIAGGLDQTTIQFDVWAPILGISTKESIQPILADSLQFDTNFMCGVNGREFSDDVLSCESLNVSLEKDCIVHISTSDTEGCPLLWEKSFGSGKVIVCNADLMESKSDRGVIASAYCHFYPVYAYPVINACVYCIDDCPSPIPAGYDNNIVSQYGYTISDFYANIWMPAMQSLVEKYGVKYSVFSIQTYENNVTGPFNNIDNADVASYYASIILNMGGEVGLHGYNHQPLVLAGYKYDEENSGYTPWPNVMFMIDSVKAAKVYTESLTEDLHIESYVAPSNVISNEALQEMLSQIEDIRVYAGIYTGTSDQFIQEFKVLDNGAVFCPRLNADMQMEDSEWWTQINELNYHYVESNFIHPDDILDEERSDGGDFNQMLSGYTTMIEWNKSMGLRDTTISECGAAVQRYANLSYEQILSDNNLEINIEGLIDNAYMMVRTNGKKIVSADGAEYTKLDEEIYILNISQSKVVLKMVDTK